MHCDAGTLLHAIGRAKGAGARRLLGQRDEPAAVAALDPEPRDLPGPKRLERLRQLLYRLRMTEAEHNLLESVMRELDDPVAERRARKRANEE